MQPITLANGKNSFDPTAATSGTFKFNQSNGGWLVLINESPVGLTVTWNNGSDTVTVMPYYWRSFAIGSRIQDINWSQEYTLPQGQAPVSLVFGECWAPVEWTMGAAMGPLIRQVNQGNPGVSQSVINDGNPTVTTVLETTPQGASASTAKITNDGNTLVAGLALAGARFGTTAQSGVGLNAANHETEIATPQTGAAQGITFITWDGASQKLPIAFGANGDGAATVILHDGSVFQLAGVTSAGGKRNVPLVIGRGDDVNITTTSLTTIASATVPNESPNPVVRCSAEFLVPLSNSNSGVVTLEITFTDPYNSSVVTQQFWLQSTNALTLINALTLTRQATQEITLPITIKAKPNTVVSIKYSNTAAGTIGDFVSGIIELL